MSVDKIVIHKNWPKFISNKLAYMGHRKLCAFHILVKLNRVLSANNSAS